MICNVISRWLVYIVLSSIPIPMVSQAGAAVGFCAAKLAISESNLGGESENADPHGIS